MLSWRGVGRMGSGAATVRTGDQDRLHRAMADGVMDERPVTGGFETVTAEPALETRHPQGRAETLFGVRSVAHRPFGKDSGMISDTAGPGDRIFRGRAGMALVRLGHMLLHRGVAAARASAGVNGHTLMVVEYLDDPVRQAHVDMLADQAVRHGMEAVQHVDAVVRVNPGARPFSVFEGFRRQVAQGGSLDLFKQVAARPADPAHRAGIRINQQFGDRGIQRLDREERHVAQPGRNPALDDQHRTLGLALVAGLRGRVGSTVVS